MNDYDYLPDPTGKDDQKVQNKVNEVADHFGWKTVWPDYAQLKHKWLTGLAVNDPAIMRITNNEPL